MRPGYFIIWIAFALWVAIFAAALGFNDKLFGVSAFPFAVAVVLTVRFRGISESERHRRAILETVDPPEMEAANLSRRPFVSVQK